MIDPGEVLGVMKRNRIIMAFERLRKVTEARCLSREEFGKLSVALGQLDQAVVESAELGPYPILISAGVLPLVNREEIVSMLQEVAKELNEINTEDWAPEAARKSLSGSLGTIEGVLGEMS